MTSFFSTCGLGDCLLHAHWLRAVSTMHPEKRFAFAVRSEIIREVWDVLRDRPVQLLPLEQTPQGAIEVPLHAEHMPPGTDLLDFIGCKVWQYGNIAIRASVRPVMTAPDDWLFDYAELRRPCILSRPFDVLVINAAPRSGQWQGYYPADLGGLIGELARKNRVVCTHRAPGAEKCLVTSDYGLTVSQIGQLSTLCRAIVAVATGPIWPTFNRFNQDTVELRAVLIDRERISLGKNVVHCPTVTHARAVLEERGFI